MTDPPPQTETARLAGLLADRVTRDGVLPQPAIPGLHLCRFAHVNADCVQTFYFPSLLIVVQGATTVAAGRELYPLDHTRLLMLPVTLPVSFRITEASASKPYLSIRLELDPRRIAELSPNVFPQGLPPVRRRSAGYITDADKHLLDAAARLVDCLRDPGDAALLAPLATDELLIRLLRGPIGAQLAEIGFDASAVRRISRAIDWLREHFAEQVRVAELAGLVHMSVSSFHEHFRAVTSMSPLQYQKALRLQEARRLMLSRRMDASAAGRMVGYVSDSQLSRDYSWFFGCPPRRDIAALRPRVSD